MAKKDVLKVPFYKGKFTTYVDSWMNKGELIYKDNYEFEASMKIISNTRGRSSVTIVVQDVDTPDQYQIFISDFMELVKSTQIEYGVIERGVYTFCKKGCNYGLKLINR